MLNEIYDFKFVAMFSKEYGHIADLMINETSFESSVYGHTTIPEDAISYFALNEVGAIIDHLERILLSGREWEPILQPDLIEESLELLAASNDDIDPQKTLNDISKYLIVTRTKDGILDYYYYKRNDNTNPGSILTFVVEEKKELDPREVGTDLSLILASIERTAGIDSKEYEIALRNIYQSIDEEYVEKHKPALTLNPSNMSAPYPNSRIAKQTDSFVRNGVSAMDGKICNIRTSKQGEKGANVPTIYEIKELKDELKDDISESMDYIEKSTDEELPPFAKDVYASICAFYQYSTPNEEGRVEIGLRSLMQHIFQKDSNNIRRMKEEDYVEVCRIIEAYQKIIITAFVDEELKQFHVNDPEKYGVAPGGDTIEGPLLLGRFVYPANSDIKKAVFVLYEPPFLLNHDAMIKQVQTRPSKMIKLRGLYKMDKLPLISAFESRILNQRSLIERFEQDKSVDALTISELKSKAFDMFTRINIYPIIIETGYAIKHPSKANDILFPEVKESGQRKKKKRTIDDIIDYFKEQLRIGFIAFFEVVRMDGGYETFWYNEEKSDIESKKSKKFNPRSQIMQIRFYCID